MSSLPWIEKYRPKAMTDVAAQQEVIAVLKKCIESANLPHLLFYGSAGTGKTSTILALARELYGPENYKSRILELNASDERGIDVVREKVKNFAKLTVPLANGSSYPCPPYKIIILDEADSMTADAQAALRRVIEQYSKVTRFCLICNYITRIIDPLASRCAKFRFKPLDLVSMKSKIEEICDKECIAMESADCIDALIENSRGDMRKAIQYLQTTAQLSNAKPITKTLISELAGVVPNKLVEELVDVWLSKDFQNIQNAIESIFLLGYAGSQLLEQLFECIIQHPKVSSIDKAKFGQRFSMVDKRLVDGCDEEIQFLSLLAIATQKSTRMQQDSLPESDTSTCQWIATEQILQSSPCCDIDKYFSSMKQKPSVEYKFDYAGFKTPPVIQITSTQKVTDLTGTSYNLYVIQTSLFDQINHEAKHRYSEFESFRNILTIFHPTTLVPPIPEKHSLGDYAVSPIKAKDDPDVIDKRTRMLQTFLVRVFSHPVLSRFHGFHLFLQGERKWKDIVQSLDFGETMKLKRETKGYVDKAAIKRLDSSFNSADEFTNKFAAHIIHAFKLHNVIVLKQVSEKTIFASLGHAYNTWSLVESQPLSITIEKIGECFDAMSLVQQRFSDIMEHPISDALHEYVLYATAVEKLFKWWYVKSTELHKIRAKLSQAQADLTKLEVSESEALRISAVLSSEGSLPIERSSGIIAKINSLIDHDPEQSRRKAISNLKDRTSFLKQQEEKLQSMINLARTEIQQDLDRFQATKVFDFKRIWKEYAQFMVQYHVKNREIWTNCQSQLK